MNKTVLTLGLVGAGIYLAQDRAVQWLNNVQVGFLKLEAINLSWDISTVRPVIWIRNGNSQPVVLKSLKGKVAYPTINADFAYDLGSLLLEPGHTVNATFSIRFENEDPFVILADRLQKKNPVPVEGEVEIIVKNRNIKIPFSHSL